MDGECADKDIVDIFKLGLKELRYSNEKKAIVFDFVGFVFGVHDTLVVFPKHFMANEEIQSLNTTNESDVFAISLLRKVIFKYNATEKKRASALRYMGDKDGYFSDYPFSSFYRIYQYFVKFGLYKERKKKITTSKGDRISWKYTLQNANKIISDNNLLFLPVYSEKWNRENVFVTDCMAFAIDYTLRKFFYFFNMKNTEFKLSGFDYIGQKKYVIQQLIRKKNTVFKDKDKELLNNLIIFFKGLDTNNQSGILHLEIKYFNLIWQDMMSRYLNRHFVSMSPSGDRAIFDETRDKSSVTFVDKKYDDIDLSSHHFYIDIDHVGIDSDNVYLFDSKYYSDMNELNYKQFSYNMILNNRYSTATNLYSILFLPGKTDATFHFVLSPKYSGKRINCTSIIEQYIEPKDLMEDYLKE